MARQPGRCNRVRKCAPAALESVESRRLLSADLDLSFGQTGIAELDLGLGSATTAYAVALQDDGKIVIAGSVDDDAYVARLNGNGTLDTTFGTGGITRIDFGPADELLDLIALPDGKILAGGAFNRSFVGGGGLHNDGEQSRSILLRLRADGQLDTASGFGGVSGYILGPTGGGIIADMKTAGGKLYTVGNEHVRRHALATGEPDTTFGTHGNGIVQAVTDTELGYFNATRVDISSTGQIAVLGSGAPDGFGSSGEGLAEVGWGGYYQANNDCVLLLTSSGAPVNTFDGNGVRFISAGAAAGIAFGSGGVIFVASSGSDHGGPYPPYLYRIEPSGAFTRTPGPAEITTNEWPADLIAGSDGKLYLAAWPAVVLRYNADGTLDQTWSRDGVAASELQGRASAIAIDSSGRVVLAGTLQRFYEGPTSGFVTRFSATPAGSGITAQLQPDGTLNITGSAGRDIIRFAEQSPSTTGMVDVLANHERFSFEIAKIQRIRIDAGGGDDLIEAVGLPFELQHTPVTIDGGAGNDFIFGHGTGDDVLLGGDGNDTIGGAAGGGADLLSGGAGSDIVYTQGFMTLDGLANDRYSIESTVFFNILPDFETIVGSDGDDRIVGSNRAETIYGGSGSDTLIGAGGADVLDGGYYDDILDGGPGDDTLHGDGAAPRIYSTPEFSGFIGNDTLLGGGGNDLLYGYSGDDRMIGGAGADQLHGGRGNDRLYGGASDDQLWGERGNDFIDGGAGADHLYGGAGIDALYGRDDDDLFFTSADNAADHLFGGTGRNRADADKDDLLQAIEGPL